MTQLPRMSVTARADGDTVLIALAGEIDLSNAASVEQQINHAITNQVMKVAVDLADIEYIDSVGMRILFSLTTRLETAQIGLRFFSPVGSPARRVIEISGLDSIVDVEPHG